MKKALLLFSLVVTLTGCVGGGVSSGVNVGVTLYPINAAANKYGVLRTTYRDYGNLSANIILDTGRETFEAQAMTVDSGYSGWGRIFSYGSAATFGGGASTAAFSSSSASSHVSVRSNALRGIADGYSTSGKKIQCEYIVNNTVLTTAGICKISDGALFRFYAKPI